MQVKFKKLDPNAVIPSYAKHGDAGMDLTAISKTEVESDGGWFTEYDTGLSVEIPDGYVGLIFPRSSQSNVNQFLTNHVGVIDSKYRGPIKFRFKKIVPGFGRIELKDEFVFEEKKFLWWKWKDFRKDIPDRYEGNEEKFNIIKKGLQSYHIGDRIGQLIILPYPKIEPIEVNELSNSERGDGGFGSSGK
jgi:dUTP pyrophosphatase